MRKRLRTIIYLFAGFACLAVLMAAGCGYSIHGRSDLPFTEIRIGKIENFSIEPKLQDKLHRALVKEFTKNGITVTPSAGNVLSGVVRKFEMSSLSEKKDVTVEYKILIDAEFTYKDSDGKVRAIKKVMSPFIISSPGSRDMGVILGSRDVAEDKAMSDIAMEIVGALIFK